jgi:hypothetical protein
MRALRTIEGALETEGSKRTVLNDVVAREIRITLGQMPAEVRDSLRKIRVYGPGEPASHFGIERGLLTRRYAKVLHSDRNVGCVVADRDEADPDEGKEAAVPVEQFC